jgi:hypothetical protein
MLLGDFLATDVRGIPTCRLFAKLRMRHRPSPFVLVKGSRPLDSGTLVVTSRNASV